MYSDDFEQAFSHFLDRREYDRLEQELLSMVRIAFFAGWRAAGGEAPESQSSLPFACDVILPKNN